MPKYKVTTEGGTYIIETEDPPAPSKGTVSVDQAQKAFQAMGPNPFGVIDNRSAMQVAGDQVMNGLEGIGQFEAGIPGALKQAVVMASQAFDPLAMQSKVNAGNAMLEGLKQSGQSLQPLASDTGNLLKSLMDQRSNVSMSTPEQQRSYGNIGGQLAGPLLLGAGIKAAPGAAQAISDLIPSKERAGSNFQKVMAAAKGIPLDLSSADDAALRAQELAGRGGLPGRGSSLPKVMRDYLRTRESQPLMTYEAGRDFQSAAGRLSSAESQAANPVMKAQVAKLAKALAESNRAAAVKAGMGDVYDAAMREYRMASGMQDAGQAIAGVLKNRAVQTGLGTGLGYGLYRAISNH